MRGGAERREFGWFEGTFSLVTGLMRVLESQLGRMICGVFLDGCGRNSNGMGVFFAGGC